MYAISYILFALLCSFTNSLDEQMAVRPNGIFHYFNLGKFIFYAAPSLKYCTAHADKNARLDTRI